MFKKLICRIKGHRRGKKIAAQSSGKDHRNTYSCSRCGAQWSRKVKA